MLHQRDKIMFCLLPRQYFHWLLLHINTPLQGTTFMSNLKLQVSLRFIVHSRQHHVTSIPLSLLWGRRVFCWSQSQLSLGEGKVQVALHWWQRPPCKVPTAHQEQVGVQYLAQGHFDIQLSPELGFEPATFQSLADLLYLLSYSCHHVTFLP